MLGSPWHCWCSMISLRGCARGQWIPFAMHVENKSKMFDIELIQIQLLNRGWTPICLTAGNHHQGNHIRVWDWHATCRQRKTTMFTSIAYESESVSTPFNGSKEAMSVWWLKDALAQSSSPYAHINQAKYLYYANVWDYKPPYSLHTRLTSARQLIPGRYWPSMWPNYRRTLKTKVYKTYIPHLQRIQGVQRAIFYLHPYGTNLTRTFLWQQH